MLDEEMLLRLERLLGALDRMRLTDYLNYLGDRRRLVRVNLLIGVARGLGTAIGFTVLGAVVIVILQRLVAENIPLIGDFLAEVIELVKQRT